MHMYFWWTYVTDNFLFPGYNIKTTGGFLATCFGLMALAVIFEWLKLLQARLRQQELFLRAKQLRTICPPSESATLLFTNKRLARSEYITLCERVTLIIWDIIVWLNMQTLGYLLMLAAMVYNGWMVISLIIGSALGYFVFGPTFMKLNIQNCHIIQETFCSLNCETDQDGETTPALRGSTCSTTAHDGTDIPETPTEVSVCVHAQHNEPND